MQQSHIRRAPCSSWHKLHDKNLQVAMYRILQSSHGSHDMSTSVISPIAHRAPGHGGVEAAGTGSPSAAAACGGGSIAEAAVRLDGAGRPASAPPGGPALCSLALLCGLKPPRNLGGALAVAARCRGLASSTVLQPDVRATDGLQADAEMLAAAVTLQAQAAQQWSWNQAGSRYSRIGMLPRHHGIIACTTAFVSAIQQCQRRSGVIHDGKLACGQV